MAKRPTNSKEELACSFCGKTTLAGALIIPGPGANICAECVDICAKIISENALAAGKATAGVPVPPALPTLNVPPPAEIKKFLDQYIIGHDYTKKMLAVAVHNHYKRLNQ
ncbi:MAG: ATP-dependent Clp protease ATP-binding subunit ClpX, partial [Verrucomicrobiota bacterium]|nr:ATP-dependent Clp protease ATP-binding subunit ClpX [Verrucomicrobiota bacterium]